MRATPEQRAAFAARLVALRRAADLTQAQVVAALADHGGTPISDAAYSEYEREKSTPTLPNAVALARIFGEPDDTFAGLLGMATKDDSTDARLSRIEEQVAEILAWARAEKKRRGRA